MKFSAKHIIGDGAYVLKKIDAGGKEYIGVFKIGDILILLMGDPLLITRIVKCLDYTKDPVLCDYNKTKQNKTKTTSTMTMNVKTNIKSNSENKDEQYSDNIKQTSRNNHLACNVVN